MSNLHEARHALTLLLVQTKDLKQTLLLHGALHRIEAEMGLGTSARPGDRDVVAAVGRSLREDLG